MRKINEIVEKIVMRKEGDPDDVWIEELISEGKLKRLVIDNIKEIQNELDGMDNIGDSGKQDFIMAMQSKIEILKEVFDIKDSDLV